MDKAQQLMAVAVRFSLTARRPYVVGNFGFPRLESADPLKPAERIYMYSPETAAGASETREERKGQFADKIHERARESAVELHRLLIALSSAALGVYFLALTSRTESQLSARASGMLLTAMVAMAVALGAGVSGWYADARRNFLWATAMMTDEDRPRNALYVRRNRWLLAKHVLAWLMGIAFTVGVVASCAYIALRVFE